jgi:hypothetical protein
MNFVREECYCNTGNVKFWNIGKNYIHGEFVIFHISLILKRFSLFSAFLWQNFISGSSRSILHPHIVRIPDKVLGKTKYSCRISL